MTWKTRSRLDAILFGRTKMKIAKVTSHLDRLMKKKKKNFSHFLIFFLNISCTFVQHLKVLLGSIFFKYCIRSQSAQHPLQVRVKIIEKEKN